MNINSSWWISFKQEVALEIDSKMQKTEKGNTEGISDKTKDLDMQGSTEHNS